MDCLSIQNSASYIYENRVRIIKISAIAAFATALLLSSVSIYFWTTKSSLIAYGLTGVSGG